jgi:DNA-binding GntR family transcriptional regulator
MSGMPAAPAGPAAATRSLLLAPLLAPTAGWTSRTIAEVTGQSQSAVARAWARSYPAESRLGDPLPATGLRLVAAAVDAHNSVLVLTGDGRRDPGFSGAFMRSPRRPPLQTLLAADLLRSDRPAAVGPLPSSTRSADARLLRTTRGQLAAGGRMYVLTRQHVGTSEPSAGHVEVVVDDPAEWQALLGELVRRCTRSTVAELLAAQLRAMDWARGEQQRLEWTTPGAAGARQPTDRAAPPAGVRSAGQALADDVLGTLVDGLTAGRLAGGERVSESVLARAAHASRGQVRDALRALAAAGLIDLEPGRGAVIPTPQVADVVETYAARRALGTLVVRRAVHWAPGTLAPVEQALHDLVEIGRSGDTQAAGEADLRFQDALARSTGMRRIPGMFVALSTQVRMFTAVLGLDYTYSIAGMCQDDATLLDRVRARDGTGAVRAWNRKIDDATTYMTTQLSVAATRPHRRAPGRTRSGSPGSAVLSSSVR